MLWQSGFVLQGLSALLYAYQCSL